MNLFELSTGMASTKVLSERARREGTSIPPTLCLFFNAVDLHLHTTNAADLQEFLVRKCIFSCHLLQCFSR